MLAPGFSASVLEQPPLPTIANVVVIATIKKVDWVGVRRIMPPASRKE